MARKSFTAYKPTEVHEIEINGTVFNINAQIPGDLLLDFMSDATSEDSGKMAEVVRRLLDAAIAPEQLDAWHTFIRTPENGVTLQLLSEIAGYVTELVSGQPGPTQQPAVPQSAG